MNASLRTIPTDYGPENRFELKPTPAAPFRAEFESSLEQLKNRLLLARLEELWEPGLNHVVRRAANEAAALAWITPYPLLFFPTLFEEKVHAGIDFTERQVEVRQRSRQLLAL